MTTMTTMQAINFSTEYKPFPKQAAMHGTPANEVLYGGAAGPGKSHALRMEALDWCMLIPGLNAYIFRRTFPELEDNHILPSQAHFPLGIGTYKADKKRWDFINGSRLFFRACEHEQDIFKFQGAEIHLLCIDELTTFTELQYDYLRGRLRCALEIKPEYRHKIPGIVCASNPGGIGHAFAKARWVDFVSPMGLRRASKTQGGMLRTYIPGLLKDNPILMERDPGYAKRLDALPEPYRTAYRDGRWDIFIGQAFEFSRERHVVQSMPVPEWAELVMTMDWGQGAPFSIGWWWVDNDGRIYRFAEWYGWNGTPGQGIRLTDPEICQGIKERETRWGISGRSITRYLGPDCWSKKPAGRDGVQGPSTKDVFAEHGLTVTQGDACRAQKIRRFRERLAIPKDGSAPMLQVYDSCEQFIRTIPLLQMDKLNVEDIDGKGEDHVYDEACHICMAKAAKDGSLTAGADWTRR